MGSGGVGGRGDVDAGGEAGEGGHAGVDSGGGGMEAHGGSGGAGGASGAGGQGGFGGPAGGGSGGAGVPSDCSDSDAISTDLLVDPYALQAGQLLEKGTTVGANGSFEDSCTDSGDLLEHVCETQLRCSGGSQPFDGACAPSPQLTGQVLEMTAPCFGLCVDGACHVPCPMSGDVLTVAQIEGAMVHLESSAGIRYACTRGACLAFPPDVGDTLAVDGSPVPNETQLDCRMEFAAAESPLVLSDGCGYTACTVQQP
jgi:hypothetical protein